MIKLYNKPILFVNSISNSINGKENQNIYDSRRVIKSRIFHRIDDINAMKYLYKKVFVCLVCNLNYYNGEYIDNDKNYIYIRQTNEVFKVNIAFINDIKIISYQ